MRHINNAQVFLIFILKYKKIYDKNLLSARGFKSITKLCVKGYNLYACDFGPI